MRVGVFGGTFDPVHRGHLHVADRAQTLFGLASIHFVVAASPPHKRGRVVQPLPHRYAMLALATSGVDSFRPSLVELESPASPFSVDTMRKLARGHPAETLFFLAGGDSLLDVRRWRASEALLSAYNFVFAARPGLARLDGVDPRGVLPSSIRSRVRDLRGLSARDLRREVARLLASPGPWIYVVDLGAPAVSSSEIRARAREGRPIARLVPAAVGEYIRKLQVYGRR